jgi:hypothetical protein
MPTTDIAIAQVAAFIAEIAPELRNDLNDAIGEYLTDVQPTSNTMESFSARYARLGALQDALTEADEPGFSVHAGQMSL